MPIQVAVCGPRHCTDADKEDAYRIGQLLADEGVTVICGGGIGVMAAVAAGVRARNGVVIGIRPNDTRDGASPDLTAHSSPTWVRRGTPSSSGVQMRLPS